MLDTPPEAETKSGPTPEQKAARQTARRIGRIVLAQSHMAQHPDASRQEVKAAIDAQKALQIKLGKQTLKALSKAGMTVTVTGGGEQD